MARKVGFKTRSLLNTGAGGFLLAVVSAALTVPPDPAESERMPERWPGCAVLGNGRMCAVYSDDPRTTSATGRRGVHHFHFGDHAGDYVRSTAFELLDSEGRVYEADTTRVDWVGMENFFTTLTRSHLVGGLVLESRAFAHPHDAIILSFTLRGAPRETSYRLQLQLPQEIVTDRTVILEDAARKKGEAWFRWSDGTVLAIGTASGSGHFSAGDEGVRMEGEIERDPLVVIIAAADSDKEARKNLKSIRREDSPAETAARHWRAWLEAGAIPDVEDSDLLEAYCRNLYAVQSSCLNGRIPADLTGQFLTHGMPQLYPRDALMCARVLMMTGHYDEARAVLQFWADPRVPMKSPGAWYARYDARGKAVDAGTGARFDVPEWDSNGYFIQLADACHAETGQWPVDLEFLLGLADFLVARIDERGLLFEGGIVEWKGYLPATNMTAAAALMAASRIAGDSGDAHREGRYRSASERISMSLGQMFDQKRGMYADLRYAERKGDGDHNLGKIGRPLYFWDTSANFGVLWGYPDHVEMRQSNRFFSANCTRQEGGMQYYEAREPGLAGYGRDLFFFTTAAAAQYHSRFGDPAQAARHIRWMCGNANVYGLMPERIFLDGSGTSPASPLSWCCAEFCAAVLEWDRRQE